MCREDLRIIEPSLEYKDELRAFVEESQAVGGAQVAGLGYWKTIADYGEVIEEIQRTARGDGIPEGWVSASTYWLVNSAGRILGTINLRHELTEHLLTEGGHVGYSVRPSERSKGYGTTMCALVLEKARALRIERILITCDDDNLASARVIEKNGGRLEDKRPTADGSVLKRRYWIDL